MACFRKQLPIKLLHFRNQPLDLADHRKKMLENLLCRRELKPGELNSFKNSFKQCVLEIIKRLLRVEDFIKQQRPSSMRDYGDPQLFIPDNRTIDTQFRFRERTAQHTVLVSLLEMF
jgi:hypothetical protein